MSMMEFEINSQVSVINDLINNYIKNYCILLDIPLFVNNISIVASGSSYNAGLLGKYFFKNIAHVNCQCEYASEFIEYRGGNYSRDTLYIFISQSGNSFDTLEALKLAKNYKVKTLCITNNSDSEMYKLADYKFDIKAGRELAIAATKTFSASVLMLWIIACKIAQNSHIAINEEMENIYLLSKNMQETINNVDNLDIASKFVSKQRDFSISAFGLYYPIAREAALKIKETSYINTCSYPLGEFIHGHYALLNKSKAFLTILTKDCSEVEINLYNKIIKKYKKTKAIIISDAYDDYDCEILVKIPSSQSKIASVLNIIATIQLLALKTALLLRRNVDKPKGLDKVVIKEKQQ